MDFHLYTTDPTGLEIAPLLEAGDRITAVIVPENRLGSPKVMAVQERSPFPVEVQRRRSELPATAPRAEAGLSWMYSQILPETLVAAYPAGIMNMHGGHIPSYRGANVLQWAIINGETELGVTWHEIVAEVDAGPIWAESMIPITPDATALTVRRAMIAEGLRLAPEALRRKRAKSPVRLPDLAHGRVWPARRTAHGRIADGWSAKQVRDMVRALCPPWPPATLRAGGEWRAVLGISDRPGADTVAYATSDGVELHLVIGPSADPTSPA